MPKRQKQLSEAPKSDTHADLLQDLLKKFDASEKYKQSLYPAWSRDIGLYNNKRFKKAFEDVSDTFVPMTFSTIETMVSAIATGDLNIDYMPQDLYKYLSDRFAKDKQFESEKERADFLVEAIGEVMKGGVLEDSALDVLNALFNYFWEQGDWDVRLEELIRSGLKIGNGAWWFTVENNRPKLITVPFRDYLWDPTATSDETCGWNGRKYLATYDKLKDVEVLDPKTQGMVKRYKNLEKLKDTPGSTGDNQLDKQKKEEMLLGSTLGVNDDQHEIIEIVTEDKMYTIADRKVVIEQGDNFFKAQAKLLNIDDIPCILPGITWANYKDESLFVGKSETATFWQEQERLNDLSNQKSSAISRSLLQNKRVDPKQMPFAKFLNIPGGVFPGPSGSVEVLQNAQTPNQAFSEENSIKNNIREVTATDQIVKGVGNSQDVTATEAKLQVAQAGQRIELKIKSLERGPLKSLGRKVFWFTRLFITEPMMIPTSTNRGMELKVFTPGNYNQDFEPRIKLEIYAKNKKFEEQKNAQESFKLIIADPTNNLEAAKKIMYPKMVDLDQAEIQQIITPAAPPPNTEPVDPSLDPMAQGGTMPGMPVNAQVPQPVGAF